MAEKKKHSVPVPRLYKEASKILQRYENKEGTLNTLIYSTQCHSKKQMLGLLSNAVQRAAGIKGALKDSNIFTKEPNFNPYLAHVLTSEILQRDLRGDCKPILVLKKYEGTLRSLYSTHAQQKPQHKVCLPRYVRINTLVASPDHVHAQLANEGWMLQNYDHENVTYDDYLQLVETLEDSTYMIDYHIPELLVFLPNTPFWDSLLYKKHAIILQDKASCLPVFLSGIKPGDNIIDGCAAPGNKTSYIAAAINNTGNVVAVDKSSKRHMTMVQLLEERGASCVTTLNQNFTHLTPDQYPDVDYIFLDPSCSGSGVDLHKDRISEERVQNLAMFQLDLLLHALSFPTVREVVYSTCSVRVEENEQVVEKALACYQTQFRLDNIKKKVPGWKHFGSEECSFSEVVLRTKPDVDKCQGFFVAKFVRKRKDGKQSDSLSSERKRGKKRKQDCE